MSTALARILTAVNGFLVCVGAVSVPLSATDDRGVVVELSKPASRIVAISPHLAELAYAAGAGDQLIAVVRGSDFPPEIASLPLIGDAFGIDYERLIALKPDLVLAWGSGNRAVDLLQLADRGIPLFVAEPRHLRDIARHVRAIGALAGSSVIAEAAAVQFERQLDRFRDRHAQSAPLSVFVEIWPQPLFTVGPQHLISEVLGLCGARNVLRAYPLPSGPVPMEAVVSAAPDLIVSVSGIEDSAVHVRWQKMRSLKAANAIISVDPDLLTRATPRVLKGAELLCEGIQAMRQTLTH